jgi:hypothetical protein
MPEYGLYVDFTSSADEAAVQAARRRADAVYQWLDRYLGPVAGIASAAARFGRRREDCGVYVVTTDRVLLAELVDDLLKWHLTYEDDEHFEIAIERNR